MQDEQLAWSLYWAQDQLHSCVASNAAEDQQSLEQLWSSLAQKLPEGAQVLDLATGNGAVPSALLKQRGDLNITAVDQADIQPNSNVSGAPELSKVTFIGNQDIRELDFSERKFDAICSQFGAEYAGLMAVSNTVLPMLASNGRLSLVVHHHESEILSSSKSKHEELGVLLHKSGLLEALMKLLQGKSGFSELEEAGAAYMQSKALKTESISGQVFEGINQIAGLLERDFTQAKQIGATLHMRVNAEYERLSQMLSVALDDAGVNAYCEFLKSEGLTAVSVTPMYVDVQQGTSPHTPDQPNHLLAWHIEATSS